MLSYIVEYFTLILGNEYFAYHPPPSPLIYTYHFDASHFCASKFKYDLKFSIH